MFQLICDKVPSDTAQTASQPTLSRFENSVGIPALFRLRELLVDQFLDSFETPPPRLALDMDGFDDPAHGQQQLTLFHGYYKQNQYFPLIIPNAEAGLVVFVSLRHGTAHASLFTVRSYQADSWNRERTVVIKAECHAAGTNRRAVVTNRPGAMIFP